MKTKTVKESPALVKQYGKSVSRYNKEHDFIKGFKCAKCGFAKYPIMNAH